MLDAESWDVGAAYAAGLILLQIVAAAVGGRMAAPSGDTSEPS